MAGYFINNVDSDVFAQLTSEPTREQGLILADYILEEMEYYLEELDDPADADIWPRDRDRLAEFIAQRFVMSDWYSDLSLDNASIWDNVLGALTTEPGEAIGIDFQFPFYGSVYWDCAQIAAAQGASMMTESVFGQSGYRYFGKPSCNYTIYPMYSIYLPQQVNELLAQLKSVEPHFAGLPDGEGTPHEQFFEGLLRNVAHAAENNRVLWVQTDT